LVAPVINWRKEHSVLKDRVITAVVMAAVFIGILFFCPPLVFTAFVALVTAVAAWEWANLCHLTNRSSRAVFTGAVATMAAALMAMLYWTQWVRLEQVLVLSCAWWALALLWVQGYPSSAVLWRSSWTRMIMGLLVLVPAFLSLVYLRRLPDGHWYVIAIVLLVAAADIGAYFAGRRFGRHKLAPNVSPGKSWEGVVGGLLAVAVIAGFFAFLRDAKLAVVLAVALPAALVSVVGDLFESMLKRYRGVKDSGHILPGHGGVLDRIDGLVAAVPVFTLAVITAHGFW
jgi:phosphatidate cytidylyltransferase